jgi:fatty acid desaturase
MQSKTRESAAKREKQKMDWLNRVFLIAGGFAAAVTFFAYTLGFGWFSLLATLPAFVGSSVLVPFALVVHDRRLALKKRLHQGKRSRKPRRKTSRPASAVSIETRAPLVERGGRVLAALPAAPL